MKSYLIGIVLIALLLSVCFTCGCTFPANENQSDDQNPITDRATLSPVTTPEIQEEAPRISLHEAVSHLGEYLDPDPIRNPDKMVSHTGGDITIHYIQGKDIDKSGNARIWSFGITTNSGTEFRAYDGSVWTIIVLSEPFPISEISVDKIISPQEVFEKNQDMIFGTSPSDISVREIEIQDGVYTLTINKSPWILRFDAGTGVTLDQNP